MFKKIYLHIGPHKTGTSYIQKFLLDNSSSLKKNGFIYPNSSDLSGDGHHNIAKYQFIKNELEDYLKSIEENNSSLILSAENFSRLNNKQLQNFNEILRKFSSDIEVIMYVRNPSSVLRSIWCESIKHGSNLSHSDFLVEHFASPRASKILNPGRYFSIFSKYFKMNLVDYESIDHRDVKAIAKSFLACIGTTGRFRYPNYEVNKSFSLAESEIYRNINIKNTKLSKDILLQKDFKKYVSDNGLQEHIDNASNNILRINFLDSALSLPYKNFISNNRSSFYNKKDIRELKQSNFEIIMSYNLY